MNKLLETYAVTQELMKYKDELIQHPNAFKSILEELRKATKNDEDNDLGEGFSEVDDPNESGEEDEADKWLKENSASQDAPKDKQEDTKQRKQYLSEWQPRSDYSPKEEAAVKAHMDNGYSHREAERLAGAHKGSSDFRTAMKSGIAPSMMSDKMMSDMKPLAKLWLEEADRKDKASADPESNTVKRQSGKLTEAHEKHTGDFNKAYGEFLNSDQVKDLKGRDRHNAVQEWKTKWKAENPQHDENLSNISEAQQKFAYSQPKAKETASEKHQHIMSGGQSMPTEMSDQEALQHLGGGKTEEGYQGTIVQDPSAAFAARNPQLQAALKPEQLERMKAVDSAASAQGKIRTRKKVT